MNTLSSTEIAFLCGGVLEVDTDIGPVNRVSTDTRTCEPGAVFLALRGEHFDGHDFLEQALEAGARLLIVQEGMTVPAGGKKAVIRVGDTLKALQELARNFRKGLDFKAVGITGSHGKTSCKEMVAAALRGSGPVVKTRGNLNNHIGVPLSLLELNSAARWGVFEVAMNHPGEIRPLAELVQPDIGVLTGIGWAHIEAFASREEIAQEKSHLLRVLGPGDVAVFPGEDPFLKGAASWTSARCLTVGTGASCDVQLYAIAGDDSGMVFSVSTPNGAFEDVRIPLFGDHMVRNAGLAVAVAVAAEADLPQALEALSGVELPQGRLNVIRFREGWLVDDTYNANPDSMCAGMRSLQSLPGTGRSWALLGAMAELGEHSESLHRWVGEQAVTLGMDGVLATGDFSKALVEGARSAGMDPERTRWFPDARALAQAYVEVGRPGDRILVKGSRAAAMEEVVHYLMEDQ